MWCRCHMESLWQVVYRKSPRFEDERSRRQRRRQEAEVRCPCTLLEHIHVTLLLSKHGLPISDGLPSSEHRHRTVPVRSSLTLRHSLPYSPPDGAYAGRGAMHADGASILSSGYWTRRNANPKSSFCHQYAAECCRRSGEGP